MEDEVRRFLLTASWLFARHGRGDRARTLCEALVEADPSDGISAAALAERLLDDGEAERALDVVRNATFTGKLVRAEALLEARALAMLGRKAEAARRWTRYCEAAKGAARTWA